MYSMGILNQFISFPHCMFIAFGNCYCWVLTNGTGKIYSCLAKNRIAKTTALQMPCLVRVHVVPCTLKIIISSESRSTWYTIHGLRATKSGWETIAATSRSTWSGKKKKLNVKPSNLVQEFKNYCVLNILVKFLSGRPIDTLIQTLKPQNHEVRPRPKRWVPKGIGLDLKHPLRFSKDEWRCLFFAFRKWWHLVAWKFVEQFLASDA